MEVEDLTVVVKFRDRLEAFLKLCIEIQSELGYVTAEEAAKRLGVSDRIAREYIDHLERLGALEYIGGGLYRVVRNVISSVLEDDTTLSVERLAYVTIVDRKVSKIYKKLGFQFAGSDRVRELLLNKSLVELGLDDFAGDSFIVKAGLPNERILNEGFVAGEYSGYTIKNYVVLDLAALTVTYVGSCCIHSHIVWNSIRRSEIFMKPDLIALEEHEEPFYELNVEYPELLIMGRKLAANFLRNLRRFENCREVLEKRYCDILFTYGSLVPHGFAIARECKVLSSLQDRMYEAFDKLMETARAKGVIVCGVISCPRDYKLAYIVREKLTSKFKVTIPRLSDYAFLYSILKEGEATAPMLVEKEKGKVLPNCYEFYYKYRYGLVRFEYISKRPIEDQKRILSFAIPLVTLSKRRNERIAGLSIIFEARSNVERNIQILIKVVENSVKRGSIQFLEEVRKYGRL